MVNYSTLIRSFDDFFYSMPEKGLAPPSDIQYLVEGNSKVGIKIQMALAGFTKDNISVTGNDRTLTIRGDNLDNKDISSKFSQSFVRKWNLKDNLDISKMEGSLENGLLTVTIPFKETLTNKYTLTLK